MNETLTLNLEYKSPNIKVKLLPAGGAKKSDDTDKAKKINDEIGKERGAVIDSAIVKTMKTNQHLLIAKRIWYCLPAGANSLTQKVESISTTKSLENRAGIDRAKIQNLS